MKGIWVMNESESYREMAQVPVTLICLSLVRLHMLQ